MISSGGLVIDRRSGEEEGREREKKREEEKRSKLRECNKKGK